jgi:hypothetical protein
MHGAAGKQAAEAGGRGRVFLVDDRPRMDRPRMDRPRMDRTRIGRVGEG